MRNQSVNKNILLYHDLKIFYMRGLLFLCFKYLDFSRERLKFTSTVCCLAFVRVDVSMFVFAAGFFFSYFAEGFIKEFDKKVKN